MPNRTVRTCEAAEVTLEDGWQQCEEPIATIGAYVCRHDHLVIRASCTRHDPAKLAANEAVGCRECKEDGHDCPMTWMTLPISAGTP